ncbi:olfactory receptor 1D4-like [Coregonus clupeaformis]|uniref:olfactory receptor 1D4-like n=1 Tax=Coregonus clupeaformis TaxID=59861 RepID=UPI001E1C7521|nr:olfactory receptor 1D4-like [Coregonus clupeaformis]
MTAYEIALPWCLTQIYWLHTYVAVDFNILAVMGYDRYVAICYPLHYHSIMSSSKICKLVALAWLYPFFIFLMYFSLTLKLKFCGRFIHFKLFLINYSIGAFFEIAQSRFNMSGTPFMFRITMSVYYALLTPLINPAIYGMASEILHGAPELSRNEGPDCPEPSKLPQRHFCAVCGFPSPYTCISCGARYFCVHCLGTHHETMYSTGTAEGVSEVDCVMLSVGACEWLPHSIA